MKILDFLKGKTNTSATEEWQQREKRKRVQFNLDVEPFLKNVIGELAKLYFAPHYAVTEHIMQIGISHLVRIAGDEAKVQVLREHLSRDHVLASELGNEGLVLRLGELEIKTLLVQRYHEELINAYRILESAVRAYRRTGDGELMTTSRKRFLGVAIDLVECLVEGRPAGENTTDARNAVGEQPQRQSFASSEPAADDLAAK